MSINPADISRTLAEAGIKPSTQRIAVMRYLMTHHTHPTADEIYRALLPDYPTISRTTVYNTLKLLVEQKCALMIDIESGNARYDGITTPHGHFICNRCGHISDFDLSVLPVGPAGAMTTETHVYYKGVCRNCLN